MRFTKYPYMTAGQLRASRKWTFCLENAEQIGCSQIAYNQMNWLSESSEPWRPCWRGQSALTGTVVSSQWRLRSIHNCDGLGVFLCCWLWGPLLPAQEHHNERREVWEGAGWTTSSPSRISNALPISSRMGHRAVWASESKTSWQTSPLRLLICWATARTEIQLKTARII